MSLRRIARSLALLIVVAALVATIAFVGWSRHGRPQRDGRAPIAGLGAEVTVRFDGSGVPHVEARSLDDLARALGWLHANDRIGQMDLARRMVTGRLAEIVGERGVASDRRMRELRLAPAAERMLEALAPQSHALLDAYAEGVNAWLEARGDDLPPDLVLLRAAPEPWTARDSLAIQELMAYMLSFSRSRELQRFRWLAALGDERTRELIGVDGLEIAPEIDELARSVKAKAISKRSAKPQNGSNNWAVDASRTVDGHALVANDPHLGLALPALWYQALLRAPDYEAAGFTIPGLPIVVIGQGPRLAWGFTNTELDVCDEFFERVSPDGLAVERDGAWIPITVTRERIRVRDGADVEIELRTTDIGPFEVANDVLPARSLAWTAYEPFDPVQPFLALARARNVDEVPTAIASFVCPVQNLVCTDSDGSILYTVLGRAVERTRGDGRMPVPAWRAEFRWSGLQPHAHLPFSVRPASGLLATANDDTRPSGFAFRYSADFAAPQRARRIRERLEARRDWTPERLGALQVDATSLYARDLVTAIGDIGADASEDARRALDALRAWDSELALTGPSALYAFFERELESALFDDELDAFPATRLGHPEAKPALLRALRGELNSRWFDRTDTPEVESRERTLALALERAWRAGERRWGADVARWRYGEIHVWRPHHALGDMPLIGRFFDRDARELPGGDTCPCVLSGVWRDGAIAITHGASLRIVADAADPDRSLAILPGGQSGHPFDEHYADQLASYYVGELRPMSWSSNTIEKHTRSKLALVPR